jgi:hypothetical protein
MSELANTINEVAEGAKVSHGFRHGKDATHFVIDFSNGYRLSVVNGMGTYGTECGLFDPDGNMPDESPLDEGQIEGWVDEGRLKEIIVAVAAL